MMFKIFQTTVEYGNFLKTNPNDTEISHHFVFHHQFFPKYILEYLNLY